MPRRLCAWANGLRQRLSENNQQQFFAYFALTVAFIAGVITALTSPFPMVVNANIAAPICWASLMVGLYLGLSTKTVCLIGTSFASIQLCVVAWYSGGIYSSALAWMAVLVMANYFIVGARVALGFLAVCIAGHALMVSADWLIGIAPDIQSVSLRESGTSLLDNSLVYIVMTLVTLLYRQSDIRIWKDVRARQLDLQEQRAKLERTIETELLARLKQVSVCAGQGGGVLSRGSLPRVVGESGVWGSHESRVGEHAGDADVRRHRQPRALDRLDRHSAGSPQCDPARLGHHDHARGRHANALAQHS
jgi:hypothetical protein